MIRTIISVALLAVGFNLSMAQDTSHWFPFQPKEDFGKSVIDASPWLDAPAGKHGFLQLNGKDYRFEDSTPVKFWGVNICNQKVAPPKAEAEQWANYLAKYGVNGVRFHKFTWDGYEKEPQSTNISKEFYAGMDYFCKQLRDKGIYYSWSHIYGHRVRPGDSTRLLAYHEVVKAGSAHLKGTTIGLVHFAPDLQDLSIELTVNMLNHVNPNTGLRYADDPALSYIELQNEDNAFFPTTVQFMQNCPTYEKLICEQFSQWLLARYETEENWRAAWGKGVDAFPEYRTGESLSKRNVYPVAHMWFLSSEALQRPEWRRRLYDTGRFLFEKQNDYYQRMAAAIRATGYKGVLVGSCWQAGDNIGHYYNLYSDYLIGTIDRHNYFGGGEGGHGMKPGKISGNNASQLSLPGSGLLGTGMQQVADRPFALSEWMSLTPNTWIVEAAPILAAYGMGLQGWDASYSFASNQPQFTPELLTPWKNVYNSDAPTHMGLYPALSRMVYNNDVTEGEVISTRNVHIPSLMEGNIGFTETVTQDWDQKTFSGAVIPEAMAKGRVVIDFVKQFTPTQPVTSKDLSAAGKKEIVSNTGQLIWNYEQQGYFTVNTNGTKAVVGFCKGTHQLGSLTLTIDNDFAVVFVNSLEKGVSIDKAKRLLVTAMARSYNTGMKYSADFSRLEANGTGPVLLEPVSFSLSLNNGKKPQVTVLDHVGKRTSATLKPVKNTVQIDGSQTQTIYYEVTVR